MTSLDGKNLRACVCPNPGNSKPSISITLIEPTSNNHPEFIQCKTSLTKCQSKFANNQCDHWGKKVAQMFPQVALNYPLQFLH